MSNNQVDTRECNVALLHRFIVDGYCPQCGCQMGNDGRHPRTIWDTEALQTMMQESIDEAKQEVTRVAFALRRAKLPVTSDLFPVLTVLFARQHTDKAVICGIIVLSNWARMLSCEMAEMYEGVLAKHPTCLATRILLLLHYYWRSPEQSNSLSSRIISHILWIVSHCPNMVRADTIIHIPTNDSDAFRAVCAKWLQQCEALHLPELCYHGALLIAHDDQDAALRMLERGTQLEPDNDQWSSLRGHLLMRKLQFGAGSDGERLELARQCDHWFSDAVSKAADGGSVYQHCDLSRIKFAIGDFEAASSIARNLAEMPLIESDYGMSSNAVHLGHTILGLVATAEGNCDLAASHLIQSGSVLGSPHLSSGGPNLALAEVLFRLGDRATVVRFLERCSELWFPPDQAPSRWIAAIQRSCTPDWDDYIDRVLLPVGYSTISPWNHIVQRKYV